VNATVPTARGAGHGAKAPRRRTPVAAGQGKYERDWPDWKPREAYTSITRTKSRKQFNRVSNEIWSEPAGSVITAGLV
jgi:hypothetical protein